MVVIALLDSRLIVLKYFGPRGSEDAEASSRGFREYNYYTPRRFLKANRVKARSAPNLII